MKKLFTVLAIASVMVACDDAKSKGTTDQPKGDSAVKTPTTDTNKVTPTVDTTKKTTMDTTKKAVDAKPVDQKADTTKKAK